MNATMKRHPRKKPYTGGPAPEQWPGILRNLRERLELTQAEAAERCGVALRTWIAWENRQNTPGRLARRLLLEAYPGLF